MPSIKDEHAHMTLRSADHPESKVDKKDKKEKKEKKEKKKKEKKEKKESKDKDSSKREKKSRKASDSSDDEKKDDDKFLKPLAKRPRHLESSPPPAETPRDSTPEPGAEKEAHDEIPENLRLSSYKISPSTVAALASRGINALFPIQAETFDHIYNGNDVLGRARTGTGKTLAFALPMVEILLKDHAHAERGRAPRVLVLGK